LAASEGEASDDMIGQTGIAKNQRRAPKICGRTACNRAADSAIYGCEGG
jgi:hypothetical protein